MFDNLETAAGLDMVLRVQEMRFELMNILVEFMDFAGEELFYIAIIGLIYWAFNKILGYRMYFGLITIIILTLILKEVFGRPRPYEVSDLVIPLFEDVGHGFPSGHVSMTLVLWGLFAYYVRRWWVTVLVIGYVAMQAFGRIYAGVHFPQDVVGGLLLGGITLALYIPLSDTVAAWWQKQQVALKIAVPLIIGLVIMFVLPTDESLVTTTGLLGFAGFAIWLEQTYVQFEHVQSAIKRAAQYILALFLTLLVVEGLDIIFGEQEAVLLAAILRFMRYGAVAVTALALVPFIGVRLRLMNNKKLANNPNLNTTSTT